MLNTHELKKQDCRRKNSFERIYEGSKAIPILNKLSLRKNYSNEEIKPKIEEDTLSHFSFKKCTRNKKRNRQIPQKELPTHYWEVNHRTSKAVLSYRPGHISKTKILIFYWNRKQMWLKE